MSNSPSKDKSGKQYSYLFFSLILTLGIFYFLLKEISLDDVISSLKNADRNWIFVFFICSLLMSLFRSLRYQLMLNISGEDAPLLGLFFITLVRNLFSDLLPARLGTLAYVILAKSRLGVSLSAASSSFAFSLLFDILVMAPILLIAILASYTDLPLVPLVLVSGALFFISALAILLAPWYTDLLIKIYTKLKGNSDQTNILSFFISIKKDFIKYKTQNALIKLFTLSALIRIFKYLGLSAFLFALIVPMGHSVHEFGFIKPLAGIASAELAASLPISGIAGFGLYEGTWAFVFSALGLSKETAVLTGISHHLFTQVYGWIIGALGAIALIWFKPVKN